MKHDIENKKIWITVVGNEVKKTRGKQESSTAKQVNITLVADKQHCLSCDKEKWVIGGLVKDGCLCEGCLQIEKLVCEKRYCPFCNKNAEVVHRSCIQCIELVTKETQQLYDICKVPLEKCSCKYCKILGRT